MCTQISITNANHNHKFKFYSGGEFQWSFTQITVRILCVYAKTFKSSFGRRGLRDLGTFAHMCLYTNSFLSRIRILKTNYNHHCNDHSNYEFSLVCKVHHSKEELQSSLQWWFKVTNFLSCVTALWGLTHRQKFVIWMMIPVKNNSNDEFLACVYAN